MNRIVILIICIYSLNPLLAQNLNELTNSHKVSIDEDSVSIYADYSTKEISKRNLKNDLYYYSFHKGEILSIQGAVIGYALDGEFEKFDSSKKIRQRGQFKNGLKHGVWKKWDSNGNLIWSKSFRKGKLHGKTYHFNNQNSEISKELNYCKGKKQGKGIEYSDGETFIVKYKKDVEVKRERKE